ncbi:MAG: YdeI/OmpD-associated family protein [Bacteroides sp.]|nr:YdeI/OmpD-associated family protein [Bacteroides sp.]
MSRTIIPDPLRVDSIEAWIRWLEEFHKNQQVVWLVFRKKSRGAVPFDYQMVLDVALCYGWVDSLLKKIDEEEYMRKFTPRKASSTWSEINKKKVEKLIKDGRMQEAGMETIRVAKKNGMWDKGIKLSEVDDSLPGALLMAFQSNPKARDQYFAMKEKSRRQYNIWINMAKRAETIRKRVNESIALLEKGKELGLK